MIIHTATSMFEGCTLLSDISAAKMWKLKGSNGGSGYGVGEVYLNKMFKGCTSLTSARDLSLLDVSYVGTASEMFAYSGLKNLAGVGSWVMASGFNSTYPSVYQMFAYSNIDDLIGLTDGFFDKVDSANQMFYHCSQLKSLKFSVFDDAVIHFRRGGISIDSMFAECENLEDASDADKWIFTGIGSSIETFRNDVKLSLSDTLTHLTPWHGSSDVMRMFQVDTPSRAVGKANFNWSYASGMYRSTRNNPLSPFGWGVSGIRLSEDDRARLGLPALDPESGDSYWYVDQGMFCGYDIMRVYNNHGSDGADVEFINDGFLPEFYKNTIRDRIKTYGIDIYIRPGH